MFNKMESLRQCNMNHELHNDNLLSRSRAVEFLHSPIKLLTQFQFVQSLPLPLLLLREMEMLLQCCCNDCTFSTILLRASFWESLTFQQRVYLLIAPIFLARRSQMSFWSMMQLQSHAWLNFAMLLSNIDI